MSIFLSYLKQHNTVMSLLDDLDLVVTRSSDAVAQCFLVGNKLLLCGNGGSASDCQHIAAEFTGRFLADRRPLGALALTTDTSALTSIGNDYSFADIFVRQVVGLGRKGDCLIGISTSGNSENVLRAVEAARELGMLTIGLLGSGGGKLMSMCDIAVVVPSTITARIQEAHILIGHSICGAVETVLGLNKLSD